MSAPGPVSVVLVDDDTGVAAAMERWLRSETSVRWMGSASSAPEAIQKIAAARPRVVLMDIGLARDEPFELLRRVLAQVPESRVIMFTGYLSPELVARSLDAGATGYVLKENEPDEILRLIIAGADGAVALCDMARRALDSAGETP